ncbi:cytochrome c oxidase accessory protein CcoG [Azospirillum agricola]|uniref:cytochrome c oxidase accessory protein CcoG n=1 Tax=Azospirillum agricola TaxID=1720247 RepID=UPI000A0F0F01|nr:cytochrome c oxidase accessory protein CcoG [Azospirillum agricola]SMH35982.1 cytochrome c oxidase accessory protein FixG [Azospirillum lipoferum]
MPNTLTRLGGPARVLPLQDGTADTKPAPFFVSRRQIHPKSVKGRYRNIKTWLGIALLALFVLLPWLRWDRGPGIADQAVLFDLGEQRFYLFGLELWPQHIYYMTGAMILAAVGLFLATSVAGRVWCGFTCPQTVWTDLYVWVEKLTEGDRGERIRLDRQPWTANKIARKAMKHAAWLFIALVTGASGIFYLADAPTLAGELLRFEAPELAVWSILFIAGSTYLMAGFMREQMCLHACPWPRIQVSMIDEESRVVTYQDWRGEGRAPLRKGQPVAERQAQGLGDCIDCGACVHVCPTGIDIRDGLQMDCIGCGLCADACNDVMTRIGRPVDLILFDTASAQAAKAAGVEPPKAGLIRPRTIVYTLMMVVVAGLMAIGMLLKPSADIAILRDRAPLFVQLSDGRVQNAYTVKISNMTRSERQYRLTVSGLDGARLATAGDPAEADTLTLTAPANAVATYRVYARSRQDTLSGASTPVTFDVRAEGGGHAKHDSVFLAP